ncbi:hypothetical protein ASE74_15925 [Pedobacter sp. Leaf216]|uniref:response regulator n=1 Tax=Pedobacter sp. Leaf216 TaxID=1735684 RepID=UPI0006FBB931|nr:response regulator [Pedobacter sp. Leaf216]KQM77887.1 hypothetical protein ASE74_15925 [Pedobacter sp. Leaf216]
MFTSLDGFENYKSPTKQKPGIMEAKKIFIVEDDLMLLETLQEIFELHGYQCQGSPDPEKAIGLIANYRPDLVILDYMLPEWNGGELCGAIRALDGFEYVPIIITSAYTQILFSLTDYGCDAILEKPFSIQQITQLVSDLLSEKRSDSGLLPKIKTAIKNAVQGFKAKNI